MKDNTKEKSKLEKEYDQINNPNKTLEEIEKVSISDYQMKEGDYKILITVYEAQELEPQKAKLFNFFDMNKSAVDGFVQIEILGQTRKTAVRKETNNPIWQESFYFQFPNMSINDLDTAKIIINVYDKNNILIANSHIGRIELDWTNIYFRRFHEIYRGWFTLSDPNEQNNGTAGYVLCNIAVLGPEDKVMVHDTAFIKDPLTTIEDTITNQKVKLIDYSINAQIYRAQSLVPLDLFSRSVDAYVVAKFSGCKVKTNTVNSLNPQWNKALKLGTGVPNKSKYLILEVWNNNWPSKDDLIGTIKIPFIDICQNKYNTPRWAHIYGPPLCAKDEEPSNYVSKMQLYGQQLGSHYRGRLLFKIQGKKYVRSNSGMSEIKFAFPYKPTPVVALKTYTLSVELIEGFQLPEKSEAHLIASMGQYLMRCNKVFPLEKEKRVCEFYHVMEDKKVQFPEDITQVPDIILYYCDGPEEKNRICFVRIKASSVETPIRKKNSDIYQLQGDKSLNKLQPFQIGGYLNARVNLYTSGAPANKTIEQELIDKTLFDMHLYIYKGEGFPPARIPGDCNPILKFNCFGHKKNSTHREGTYNPFWSENVLIDSINMQDLFVTNITKGLVVQAFDYIDGDKKDQFIGSFLIKVNSSNLITYKPNDKDKVQAKKQGGNCNPAITDFIFMKPKWYYVTNPHIEIGKHIFGKVLIGLAVFRKEDLTKGKIPKYRFDFKYREQENQKRQKNGGQKYKKLIQFETRKLQVYVIGLRNIRNPDKKVLTKGQAQLNIIFHKSTETVPMKMKQTLKRSGCDFNRLIELEVEIPKNRSLTPFIDFKVIHDDVFYGFNSCNLYKLVPKLKEKEGDNQNSYDDSEDTILDVQGLQNQLEMLRQKKKRQAEEKNKDDEFKDIKQLPVPPQLGNANLADDKQGDQQLEAILDKAMLQVRQNDEFKYVQDLIKYQEGKLIPRQSVPQDNKYNGQNPSMGFSVVQTFMNGSHAPDVEDEEALLRQKIQKDKNQAISRQSISRNSARGASEVNNVIPKGAASLKVQGQSNFRKKKGPSMKNLGKTYAFGDAYAPKKKQQIIPIIPEKPNKMIEEVPAEKQDEGYEKIQSSKGLNELLAIGKDTNRETKNKKYGQEQKMHDIILNNNEQNYAQNYKDAQNRFDINGRNNEDRESQMLQSVNFQIKTDQQFSDKPVQQRAVKYKDVQRVMKQQERDQKEALQRDKQYKFAQAVKLTLFGWNRKKKQRNIQTYQDYDSQTGQDLNIIPEWYKGRKILTSDFEDLSFKCSKIHTIPLFGGKLLERTTIYQRYQESAGHIKMVCLSEATQKAKEKEEEYTKLLKQKEYYVRIYCLKGKSLISHYEGKPTTYLKFSFADQEYSFEKIRKVENENNPEYYICQEIQVNLPGPSVIKIQVIQTHDILGKLIPKVLGYTELDVQQRYFTKKWHLYEKKPIQLRNLYSEYGIGSQGRLQTWVDLIEKKKWINTPAHKIHPPPFDKYELRVIVWKTDDCVYKNQEMESNDVFVRGVIGTSEPQETDTHWACRSTGSFNYRFKFPVFYPPKPEDMYSDIFAVQIWDRDLIGFNNLIGEYRINLNQLHKIIQKAVKRRKTVKASMKVKEKNFAITDRFWYDVYNHKQKDEFGIPQPQGRVQLGFELVPFEKAEQDLKNGYGRSEPNVYPTLPQPQGRLKFDFFSPLSFLKQILGPNLYRKCCCKIICCIVIVLLGLLAYIFLPTFIAVRI